jgi:hypothetical protein
MLKIEYTQHYVAFIDVLGWTDAIAKSILDSAVRHELSRALQQMTDPVERATIAEAIPDMVPRFKATHFSDSIVLSAVADGGPIPLARQVQRLCWSLLQCGYLTRGGMVIGDLYHDGTHVLGPALVAAYQIESEVAKYPRVVLSPAIEQELRNPYETKLGHRDDRFVRDDFDGIPHLHLVDAVSDRNIASILQRKRGQVAAALDVIRRKQNEERDLKVSQATLMTIAAKNHWMVSYLTELAKAIGLEPPAGGAR